MRVLISVLLFLFAALAYLTASTDATAQHENIKDSQSIVVSLLESSRRVKRQSEFPKPHDYGDYGDAEQIKKYYRDLTSTTKRPRNQIKILRDKNGRKYYRANDGNYYYV